MDCTGATPMGPPIAESVCIAQIVQELACVGRDSAQYDLCLLPHLVLDLLAPW